MQAHFPILFNCWLKERSKESAVGKCNSILTACITLMCLSVVAQVSPAFSQAVLFDFDSAPLHSSLPIDQTVGGITAHLSATGQGCSIQDANVLGFTPPGFAGRIVYPNSLNLTDLLIRFDQALTDFSIMYSVNELGCDTSATMRVTAFSSGTFVGTNTRIASVPGTWPVDTLRCNFLQGFDSVVVHYDHLPVTCQDYGPNFMTDNMLVTPLNASVISNQGGDVPDAFTLRQNYPNPFNPSTRMTYSIPNNSHISLVIYDVLGREVATLVEQKQSPGEHTVTWNADSVPSGVYFYRIVAGKYVATKKMILMK